MGLVHYAFPDANFSRYLHSIGTCHITGRIFESLLNKGIPVEDDKIKIYRLAALLHDIGHYPYSHTMERAVKEFYSSREDAPIPYFKDHEAVGIKIIKTNPSILKLLSESEIDQIGIILSGESAEDKFRNIISSDFDVDRIDYLLRVAHATGLPYGVIDQDYLIDQVEITKDGRICLSESAIGAADHFLMSRFFQYKQIINQRVVKGFEWLLEDLIKELVILKIIDLSKATVTKMILNEKNTNDFSWSDFDDHLLMQLIKDLYKNTADQDIKLKAKSVLFRKEPSLVIRFEKIARSDGDHFEDKEIILQLLLPTFADEFNIPISRWKVDFARVLKITSIPPAIPYYHKVKPGEEESEVYQNALYIKLDQFEDDPKTEPNIIPISETDQSLTKQMANYYHFSLRLYVLLAHDESSSLPDIIKFVQKEFESKRK